MNFVFTRSWVLVMFRSVSQSLRQRASRRNRCFSTLLQSSFGLPENVLSYTKTPPSVKTESSSTSVKWLYSPINPADKNILEGVYPLKPSAFPAVPGSEGVGEIVTSPKHPPGTLVFPRRPGFGLWTSENCAVAEDDLIVLPPSMQKMDPLLLSAITVNPCTALRMLKDFIPVLESGGKDVVIQNLPNSAVGRVVSQICKANNVSCIALARRGDRDDAEWFNLRRELKGLGNVDVVDESSPSVVADAVEILSGLRGNSGNILALNGVGGRPASALQKIICDSAAGIPTVGHPPTVVTYGGMSKKPVIAGTGHLIFGDVCLRGFWMTRWYGERMDGDGLQERVAMYEDVVCMIENGELVLPEKTVFPLKNWGDAIAAGKNAVFECK